MIDEVVGVHCDRVMCIVVVSMRVVMHGVVVVFVVVFVVVTVVAE